MALFNFLGVVLHEAAHLIVGTVLGAKPSSFSLYPKKTNDGWILGSVGFHNLTALNSLPTALAPLWLAGGAYLAYSNWYSWFACTAGSTMGLYLTIYALLYNSLPSKRDWEIALNPPGLLLYLVIGLLVVGIRTLFLQHS